MRAAARHVLLIVSMLTAASTQVEAKPGRSAAAVAQFKREHPCPSNGSTKGKCPGHVVDHVVALCAGGPDDPRNMQWQTVEEAKRKDREERAQCSAAHRGAKG